MAPPQVEKIGRGLHLIQPGFPYQTAGLVIERSVDGHQVACRNKFIRSGACTAPARFWPLVEK